MFFTEKSHLSNQSASKTADGQKEAEHSLIALVRMPGTASKKDSASSDVPSAVAAGIIGTAGLLTMAYGAVEFGPGGILEVAIGGTAMLVSLVIAIMPHHY